MKIDDIDSEQRMIFRMLKISKKEETFQQLRIEVSCQIKTSKKMKNMPTNLHWAVFCSARSYSISRCLISIFHAKRDPSHAQNQLLENSSARSAFYNLFFFELKYLMKHQN